MLSRALLLRSAAQPKELVHGIRFKKQRASKSEEVMAVPSLERKITFSPFGVTTLRREDLEGGGREGMWGNEERMIVMIGKMLKRLCFPQARHDTHEVRWTCCRGKVSRLTMVSMIVAATESCICNKSCESPSRKTQLQSFIDCFSTTACSCPGPLNRPCCPVNIIAVLHGQPRDART